LNSSGCSDFLELEGRIELQKRVQYENEAKQVSPVPHWKLKSVTQEKIDPKNEEEKRAERQETGKLVQGVQQAPGFREGR